MPLRRSAKIQTFQSAAAGLSLAAAASYSTAQPAILLSAANALTPSLHRRRALPLSPLTDS